MDAKLMNPRSCVSDSDVRSLLRCVKRPHVLASMPLVQDICAATGKDDPAGAVLSVVETAFNLDTWFGRRLRESIVRCDLDGATTLEAASAMSLSPRQCFRYRSDAIAAVKYAIQRFVPSRRSC